MLHFTSWFKYIFYFLFFILFSCSTYDVREQKQLRLMLENHEFENALSFINESSLAKNKRDQLLFYFEKGNVFYTKGDYQSALDVWTNAHEILIQRYTKVSQKVLGVLAHESNEDFFGYPYEISALYYLSTLACYQLYLSNSKKNHSSLARNYLFKARSYLLSWDNYLKSLNLDNEFKYIYFDDYYARFFAAQIHELIGGQTDLEISLNLYEDSYNLFLLQGRTFRQFESQFDAKIAETLSSLKDKDSWKEKTKKLQLDSLKYNNAEFVATKEFIIESILNIVSKIRPNELAKYEKKYFFKKPKNKVTKNVVFLLHSGIVPEKLGETVNLSLSSVSKDSSASSKVLAIVANAGFLVFAHKTLGLGGVSVSSGGGSSFDWYQTNSLLKLSGDVGAALAYEVPTVDKNINRENWFLEISDNRGQIIESHKPFQLVSSFGEWNFQTVMAERAQRIVSKGARFVTKHVIAMMGAYALYQSIDIASRSQNAQGNYGDGGSALAKFAAISSYLASAKLIELSEKADLRSWSTLPKDVFQIRTKLQKGEYKIWLVSKNDPNSKIDFGVISVNDNEALQIFPLQKI